MAGRRGVRQARRRSHRRLRQDQRPWTYPRSPSTPSLHKAPYGGEGPGPNPPDRAKIGWKWSVATDLFADPDRLGDRRRQPQRQHPAQTHTASRRRPRPAPRRRNTAPGPRLRQQPHHATLPGPRTHRRHLRQEETQGRGQSQETTHPGPAMARRAHQLLAIQLRPAPPQHRQVQPATPRTDRPRHHPHPDRETRQMGQAMDRLGHLSARALSLRTDQASFPAAFLATAFFLAVVFLAVAFFAVDFLAVVFLAARLRVTGPRARFSANSSAPRSGVIVSGASSLRKVALVSPSVT